MDWLNYHHLLYFWIVAREGSLTGGSARLRLTPQTVSAQIRSLEEVIGHDLFDRSGRTLQLTDEGRHAYRYADEIFSLGSELMDSFKGLAANRPLRLTIGVADVLPKLIAHRLIEPALLLEEQVQIICHEDQTDRLLADLSIHELDVVLTDAPIPPNVKVRAFNHLLGECGVSFMASRRLAAAHGDGFPNSLNGAPLLLPTEGTTIRRSLEKWLEDTGIRPEVVGEFADSALLKVFGQAGVGVFTVPTVIEAEVRRQYQVRCIGVEEEIVERFYAISVERKVQHPAVAAICDSARADLFAG